MSTQFYTPGEQATSPMEGWNDRPRRRIGVGVDARKLWAGGVASAVVAGLLALVGVLVSRWLFNLPVLAPRQDGAYGDVRTTALILAAMAAALAATGLVHLLMLGFSLSQLSCSVWIDPQSLEPRAKTLGKLPSLRLPRTAFRAVLGRQVFSSGRR
jgi:hypothetical protein